MPPILTPSLLSSLLSIHLSSPLLPLFLLPSAVDFFLAVAVIRSEMDGPAPQSSPSPLLVMDLPARPLESFFEPLGVSYPSVADR